MYKVEIMDNTEYTTSEVLEQNQHQVAVKTEDTDSNERKEDEYNSRCFHQNTKLLDEKEIKVEVAALYPEVTVTGIADEKILQVANMKGIDGDDPLNNADDIKQLDGVKTDIEYQEENKVPKEEVHIKEEISEESILEQGKIEKQNEEKKKHSCDVCGKQFGKASYLHKHHEVMHKILKTFKCKLCGKLFALPEYLKKHLLRLHGQTKIPCEICGKLFGLSKDLDLHLIRHHVPKPDKVDKRKRGYRKQKQTCITNAVENQTCVCDDCGKEFSSKSCLGLHQRIIHKGEKPYVCDECEQTFREKSLLKAHKVKEHGEPFPHLCPECGQGCMSAADVRRHIKLGLLDGSHVSEEEYRTTKKRDVPEWEPPACGICGKNTFRDTDAFKRHMQRKDHLNSKEFLCPHCGREYSDKRTLVTHVKTVHLEEVFNKI
eukprot:GFUD01038481.1.p1 GENE.GFUD01038481.1~~GFUD01038481.1.p1  ORF type:complete len:431 (-),score=94.49 GFUD01038481.1:84-1376(-)